MPKATGTFYCKLAESAMHCANLLSLILVELSIAQQAIRP